MLGIKLNHVSKRGHWCSMNAIINVLWIILNKHLTAKSPKALIKTVWGFSPWLLLSELCLHWYITHICISSILNSLSFVKQMIYIAIYLALLLLWKPIKLVSNDPYVTTVCVVRNATCTEGIFHSYLATTDTSEDMPKPTVFISLMWVFMKHNNVNADNFGLNSPMGLHFQNVSRGKWRKAKMIISIV